MPFDRRPKATYHHLLDKISYQVKKSGLELRAELEDQGMKTSHMCGAMYVHLMQWEEQGIIKSQVRALTSIELQRGQDTGQQEYWRISTRAPKELEERIRLVQSLPNRYL